MVAAPLKRVQFGRIAVPRNCIYPTATKPKLFLDRLDYGTLV
jgi:hypothetical protein